MSITALTSLNVILSFYLLSENMFGFPTLVGLTKAGQIEGFDGAGTMPSAVGSSSIGRRCAGERLHGGIKQYQPIYFTQNNAQ